MDENDLSKIDSRKKAPNVIFGTSEYPLKKVKPPPAEYSRVVKPYTPPPTPTPTPTPEPTPTPTPVPEGEYLLQVYDTTLVKAQGYEPVPDAYVDESYPSGYTVVEGFYLEDSPKEAYYLNGEEISMIGINEFMSVQIDPPYSEPGVVSAAIGDFKNIEVVARGGMNSRSPEAGMLSVYEVSYQAGIDHTISVADWNTPPPETGQELRLISYSIKLREWYNLEELGPPATYTDISIIVERYVDGQLDVLQFDYTDEYAHLILMEDTSVDLRFDSGEIILYINGIEMINTGIQLADYPPIGYYGSTIAFGNGLALHSTAVNLNVEKRQSVPCSIALEYLDTFTDTDSTVVLNHTPDTGGTYLPATPTTEAEANVYNIQGDMLAVNPTAESYMRRVTLPLVPSIHRTTIYHMDLDVLRVDEGFQIAIDYLIDNYGTMNRHSFVFEQDEEKVWSPKYFVFDESTGDILTTSNPTMAYIPLTTGKVRLSVEISAKGSLVILYINNIQSVVNVGFNWLYQAPEVQLGLNLSTANGEVARLDRISCEYDNECIDWTLPE